MTRPVAAHASHGSPPAVPLPVVPLPAHRGHERRESNLGSRYWRPNPPQRIVICQPCSMAMRSSRANSRCPAFSACFRSQRTRRVRTLCSLVTLVTLVKALFLPLNPRAGMVSSWTGVTASVQLLRASLAAVCRVHSYRVACQRECFSQRRLKSSAKVTALVPPDASPLSWSTLAARPTMAVVARPGWPGQTVYVVAPLPPSGPALASLIEDRQRF